MIIDLFAGPGGWDEGLRLLGITEDTVGLEWDEAACATAEAAGHRRYRADLSLVATDKFGPVTGLIASPPCQAWSRAGKQLGKLDKPRIMRHLDRVRDAGRWLHYSREGWHDDRSPLVLEPVRWALETRPEWIACEQVPAVLPFWQTFGDLLAEHGYATAVGKLSAEQYGVPQTRQRAILVARRYSTMRPNTSRGPGDRLALPAPTHQAYTKRKPYDPASPLPRWVSMAEALGWGMTERPYPVLASGRTTGGPDREKVGRSAARALIYTERDAGRWVMRNGAQARAAERSIDEPAPTIIGGHDTARRQWVRFGNQANSAVRELDEPAATIRYLQRMSALDRFVDGEPVRVSIEQAARLQSFRRAYPWHGNQTKRYAQIGDAVPPLLGAAILGNLLDVPNWRDVCHSMRPPADVDERPPWEVAA